MKIIERRELDGIVILIKAELDSNRSIKGQLQNLKLEIDNIETFQLKPFEVVVIRIRLEMIPIIKGAVKEILTSFTLWALRKNELVLTNNRPIISPISLLLICVMGGFFWFIIFLIIRTFLSF